MDLADYNFLKKFFRAYTNQFLKQEKNSEPFEIKIVHTKHVCDNIKILAQEMNWNGADFYKAIATGLLHDIGRFPQYKKHGTFSDAQSFNHGALGVEVIRKHEILSNIEKTEKQQIIKAVALHNVFSLPNNLNHETLKLTRLIRDADKLDIYRVMIELYEGTTPGKTSFITHHLPNDGHVSTDLIKNIENGQLIDIRNVKTLNDMKLLQISWIFDLNFPISLNLVRERNYIEAILSSMPQSIKLERVRKAASIYLNSYLY